MASTTVVVASLDEQPFVAQSAMDPGETAAYPDSVDEDVYEGGRTYLIRKPALQSEANEYIEIPLYP